MKNCGVYLNYQNELKQKGISLEMRVISTKHAYDEMAHDRFII